MKLNDLIHTLQKVAGLHHGGIALAEDEAGTLCDYGVHLVTGSGVEFTGDNPVEDYLQSGGADHVVAFRVVKL